MLRISKLTFQSFSNYHSTMSPQEKEIEILNKEFEDLLVFCKKRNFSKDDMDLLFRPLRKQKEMETLKSVLAVGFAFIAICWTCNYFDFLNWNVSAIGRIIMIKFLPLWDWTKLYNSKCLIENSHVNGRSPLNEIDEPESFNMDCILCEYFDEIEMESNTSFTYLQRHYLDRGLPVLINNSHESQDFDSFIENLRKSEDFVDTDPCDVETSFFLSRLVNIEDILEKVKANENSSFFFHLRNCGFKSVKASRTFIPKAYYYPPHMEPYYSSWLLVSSDFPITYKYLRVQGLIMVQQLNGNLRVKLTPRTNCVDICDYHEFFLLEGEGLVFTTDLWTFSYCPDDFGTSVTTITETHLD